VSALSHTNSNTDGDGHRRPFSLQKRLRWGLWGVLLLVFAILWLAASITIHKLVEHYLVTRLQHDADMLATQLYQRDGQWYLHKQAIGPIYQQPHSGHYFVIEVDRQRISSPSLAGFPLWTPARPQNNPYETLAPAMLEKRPFPEPASQLEPVLVYVKQTTINGHPVRIYVAEDHTPIQRYLYWFDAIFALLALATLAGTAWLTRRLVQRGFDTLSPLEKQLNQHASGRGAFELPEEMPTEIMPLAYALENSLRSQNAQLQRYRHANADLAHALKTPLHIIFQQLDQPALKAHPQIRKPLQQQAERLHALVERQLRSARLAENTWQSNAFSLHEHLPELLDAMGQLYPDIQLAAPAPPPSALWPMEKEDAFELLGTVLDNACKWARSQVMIQWRKDGDSVCLYIDDDGPGVPETQRNALIKRGHRLDENAPGQGLGLAIAEEIVRRYHGRLLFSESPSGGLQVGIELPLNHHP